MTSWSSPRAAGAPKPKPHPSRVHQPPNRPGDWWLVIGHCLTVGEAGGAAQQGRRAGPCGGRAGLEPDRVREAGDVGRRVAPHVRDI